MLNFSRQSPTIVWAIEAFSSSTDSSAIRMASVLRWLFPHATLIPVYILSDAHFANLGFSRSLRTALKPAAAKSIARFFSERDDFPCLDQPRVLFEASASQDECAHKLVRFAAKTHADLIAIGSHERSVFSRLFGRSFSDAVLHLSHLPLLIAGPQVYPYAGPLKKAVLASDFISTPADSFDEFISLVASFGAELHLLHKSQSRAIHPLQAPGVSIFSETFWLAHSSAKKNETRQIESLHHWAQYACLKGIKTCVANENFREPSSQAIVHYLRRLGEVSAIVGLIMQAGHGALVRGVIRDIIRLSPYPVCLSPTPGY